MLALWHSIDISPSDLSPRLLLNLEDLQKEYKEPLSARDLYNLTEYACQVIEKTVCRLEPDFTKLRLRALDRLHQYEAAKIPESRKRKREDDDEEQPKVEKR